MTRLLKQGDRGSDVRAVQDVLNFHIRRLEPLDVDGIFGPKTDARVREFQWANGLAVDGIVGPNTAGLLFEASSVPVTLLLMPNLQLTFPGSRKQGVQPPSLIPPLQIPGLLPPLPTLVPSLDLRLSPDAPALLPNLGAPANVLQLKFIVPTRYDPVDPNVRARNNIVELIDQLPVNAKFRAFLIGQVPDPATKISPPPTGFRWGIDPLFDPFDPKGFGVKGNAAFTVRVTGGARPEAPNVVFGAWGDGKVFLDFTSRQGQARPNASAEGKLILGVQGSF